MVKNVATELLNSMWWEQNASYITKLTQEVIAKLQNGSKGGVRGCGLITPKYYASKISYCIHVWYYTRCDYTTATIVIANLYVDGITRADAEHGSHRTFLLQVLVQSGGVQKMKVAYIQQTQPQ